MELDRFVDAIHHGDPVTLQPSTMWEPSDASEVERTTTCLQKISKEAALHAPGLPPDFSPSASFWGARTLRWFAAMLLDRVQTDVSFPTEWTKTQPDILDPSAHWSVDLTLRFLPDLQQRLGSERHSDPLAETMQRVAERWPLSTGVVASEQNTTARAWDCIRSHPTLRRMSIERWPGDSSATFPSDERTVLEPWASSISPSRPS